MFDVSFSELMVIAVVALLVIGPEKLPKVARTVGAFVGRMQRYMAQVKEEVNREMRFEELKNLQQEIKHTIEQEVTDLRANIHEASDDAQMMLQENIKPKPKTKPKKSMRTSAPKTKVAQAGVAAPKNRQAKTKTAKPKTTKPKATKSTQ